MNTKHPLLVSLFSLLALDVRAGNWQVVPSPNVGRAPNELRSVSAAGDNDIWAVGAAYSNTEFTAARTLIEHWNGSAWTAVASPNGSSALSILEAVSAIASDNVWAVGLGGNGGTTNFSLIEHWDGTSWRVVPGPATTKTINNLTALAPIAADDIWAIGVGRNGDEDSTITIHWDGAQWTLVPSPNITPEVDNDLAGAFAVAMNDVWAVGTQQPRSLTDPHTLILHWDGNAWKIVPSPNDGGSTVGNHLLAATAVASNDVWALGYSEFGTLSEHWDGSAWSVIATPAANDGFLESAVALSNGTVWSVGQFFQSKTSRDLTLTEFWDGSIWNIVRSANKGPSHNQLSGITATPDGTLWSVGNISIFPTEHTLVLRKTP